MRCLLCEAEMILMKVVPDETMAVPGFAHHTFMCSACYDVERRLIFTNPSDPAAVAPVPVAPSIPRAPAEHADVPEHEPLAEHESAVEHEPAVEHKPAVEREHADEREHA